MIDRVKLENTLNASIETQAFSGVISIRQKDQVLYERPAGYADRSNRIENTLDTRFGIASGTKFLTALAIGKLIAAGKLALATRLTDCVALDLDYPPEITIQQLLTHTSGIPDYYDEEKVPDFDNFYVSIPWYELKGPRDYLAIFPREPMNFAPGTGFSYCNGGYILLGVVIEELTGRRYQEFVEDEIFKPSGMVRSGFFAFNHLPDKVAQGYVETADGWRTNIYNLPIVGASDGGAFMTIDDVARLWAAFWGNNLLPQELVKEFAKPYVKAESARGDIYCGHGLWVSKRAGRDDEIYFTGSDAGVSFKSTVVRAQDLMVTVISNTSDGEGKISRVIEKVLDG